MNRGERPGVKWVPPGRARARAAAKPFRSNELDRVYPLPRMIQVSEGARGSLPLPEPGSEPWSAPRGPTGLAFATLWSTGPDPSRDTVFRVQAQRCDASGHWESFAAFCTPRPGGCSDEHASARMAREFGVTGADLAGASDERTILRDLLGFLRGCAVITDAREPFLAWWRGSCGETGPAAPVLALADVASLCLPGRLAAEGEGLASRLLGGGPDRGPRAIEPAHLRAALGCLAAQVLEQEVPVLAVLGHVLRSATRGLGREDPAGSRTIELVLALLEHPSAWKDPARALQPEGASLVDGALSAAAARFPTLQDALEAARPRWSSRPEAGRSGEAPAVRCEEERTLDSADRRAVDEIFQAHLPRHFAEQGGESRPSYRESQHSVAAVIAEGFGARELRLVHAPTGTGKTLAYLVPVALWAFRNNVRVGVATFTRALQEQAMEREVPLALALLRAAAGAQGIRVSALKGRQNYLCWRALTLQVPRAGDPPEEWLAWGALALFALRDPGGDLDGFSLRAPFVGPEPARARTALERLLRAVRCETGCCTLAADRATCAAEAAWRAAEQAHVVVANHALVLARRDFFQHLVFDECEHLHDVAANAFSAAVNLRELAGLLGELHGSEGRRPLNRVASLASRGSAADTGARECIASVLDARDALAGLREGLLAFKDWRAERSRERMESDLHSLFREYALEEGAQLVEAHGRLVDALGRLSAGLAGLQESLDGALSTEDPGARRRETVRLRRALEILRLELEEGRAGVEAWIPRDGAGRPAFGADAFHDLEANPAGDDVLSTRVLLPHEYLGRRYYPTLAGAVLLSATTWLRGGFEAAATYLGLARAAQPLPEEEREPCAVHAFRASETFDYSRVLVCVPRDAPPIHEKESFLEHAARFLGFLAERTRGRLLGLFTNAEDLAQVGAKLAPFFAERGIPFWWQRMSGVAKEELGQLFRAQVDSVLLGLDTFWFGADFPGSTLEYLVIVRLPYSVPDRYHHAQCAALGPAEQRRAIYLPRALAKFRQGFGRLMRKETDRGCVFVLDKRLLDPRHRLFLRELPLRGDLEPSSSEDPARLARLVVGHTDRCLEEALAHTGMKADVRRRGLERSFEGWRL